MTINTCLSHDSHLREIHFRHTLFIYLTLTREPFSTPSPAFIAGVVPPSPPRNNPKFIIYNLSSYGLLKAGGNRFWLAIQNGKGGLKLYQFYIAPRLHTINFINVSGDFGIKIYCLSRFTFRPYNKYGQLKRHHIQIYQRAVLELSSLPPLFCIIKFTSP